LERRERKGKDRKDIVFAVGPETYIGFFGVSIFSYVILIDFLILPQGVIEGWKLIVQKGAVAKFLYR